MTQSANLSNLSVILRDVEDALQFLAEKKVNEVTAFFLTTITITLICIAALGNSFTIYVIVTQREMRSAKYGFILNLAFSDLLLCLFTQPFNLLLTLERTWRFGVFLCQFIMVCQGMSVFASSFSITAIAVDRLHVVMRKHVQSKMEKKRVLPSIVLIWLISITLASPCYFFSELKPLELESVPAELFASASQSLGIGTDMCKPRDEEFYTKLAALYSLFCLIVQFLINFLIISGTHCAIWLKVVQRRKKMAQTRNETRRIAAAKRASESRRRKAKYLLFCITLTFVISWLPLNLLNLAIDFSTNDSDSDSSRSHDDVTSALLDTLNSSRFFDRAKSSLSPITVSDTSESADEVLELGWNLVSEINEYEMASGITPPTEAREDSFFTITDFLFPAANVLSLLSAVLNPIYYGWFNNHFRRHFLTCIGFFFGRRFVGRHANQTAHHSDSDDAVRSRLTNTVHTPRSTCATPLHPSMSRENVLNLSSTVATESRSLHPPVAFGARAACARHVERIAMYEVSDKSDVECNGKLPAIRIVIECIDSEPNELMIETQTHEYDTAASLPYK